MQLGFVESLEEAPLQLPPKLCAVNEIVILQGSATTVWAATASGLEAHAGAYCEDCHVSQPNKHGQDAELAQKLWQSTEEQIRSAMP